MILNLLTNAFYACTEGSPSIVKKKAMMKKKPFRFSRPESCTAGSIFYCVRCFIPKIEGNYEKNVFFFSDVIYKFGNIKEFSKTFYDVSVNEEKFFGQLGEQIYIISKIAAWKFRNVKRAIRLLAMGLMLLFITAGYYMILVLK